MKAAYAKLPELRNTKPYTVRVGEIDPNTGWWPALVRAELSEELVFSVIVGEFVQCLRTCLDYIVTALVDASRATLTEKHGFPIYTDPTLYHATVFGKKTNTVPREGGPLGGVKYGLAEIAAMQPYNTLPKPQHNTLWILQTLSNADKHRQLLQEVSVPVGGVHLRVRCERGRAIDSWRIPEFVLFPGEEKEVLSTRFAPPFPSEMRVEGTFDVEPAFRAPKIGKQAQPVLVMLSDFELMRDHVRMIVNLFQQL